MKPTLTILSNTTTCPFPFPLYLVYSNSSRNTCWIIEWRLFPKSFSHKNMCLKTNQIFRSAAQWKYQKHTGKNNLCKKKFPLGLFCASHAPVYSTQNTCMNLNDFLEGRTEFGHTLNETFDSSSLYVPRKTNLIKPKLEEHSNSLSPANRTLFTNSTQ